MRQKIRDKNGKVNSQAICIYLTHGSLSFSQICITLHDFALIQLLRKASRIKLNMIFMLVTMYMVAPPVQFSPDSDVVGNKNKSVLLALPIPKAIERRRLVIGNR